MERIKANEVKSMMEAYASVYKTEDQEVISEKVDNIVPNRGAYDKLTKAQERGAAKKAEVKDKIYRDGGGDAKVKEFQDKGYTLGQARRATMNQGRTNQRKAKPSSQSTTSGMTPAQVKAAQDAANQARRDGKMGGLPADYKKTELEAGKTAERYRTGAGLPKSGGGNQGQGSKTAPKPNPNVTSGGTKFERRLPTMAELRAAQQARKDAPKVLSRGEIENRAVKAGVGVSKGTVKDPKIAADAARKAELERIRSRAASQTKAGVRPTVASTADPKTPPPANAGKPAGTAAGGIRNPTKGKFTVDNKVSGTSNTYNPGQKMSAGDSATVKAAQSALRAGGAGKPAGGKEDIFTSTPPGGKPYGNARPKPRGEDIFTSTPPGGKPYGNAAKPTPKPAGGKEDIFTSTPPGGKPYGNAAKPAAAAPSPVVKKKPPMGARNRMRMEELDVFDTIKEYLIGEGATEEEALKQMLTLTDEQRTEIIEGSCGSKSKKKKKGGY